MEIRVHPAKMQRLEGQHILFDVDHTDRSHSDTPQYRRSSFDPFRNPSAAQSKSNFDVSKMTSYVKSTLFGTSFDVPPGLIDEIIKRNWHRISGIRVHRAAYWRLEQAADNASRRRLK
jgi:hypothetical protein